MGKATSRASLMVGKRGFIGDDCFVSLYKAADPQKVVRNSAVYGEQKLPLISL